MPGQINYSFYYSATSALGAAAFFATTFFGAAALATVFFFTPPLAMVNLHLCLNVIVIECICSLHNEVYS